jgi:hypothetical protein
MDMGFEAFHKARVEMLIHRISWSFVVICGFKLWQLQ